MKLNREKTYLESYQENFNNKFIQSYRDYMDLPFDAEITEDLFEDFEYEDGLSATCMRANIPIERGRAILLGKGIK